MLQLYWIVNPRVTFKSPNVILRIFHHLLQLIFLKLNWIHCHPQPHLVGEALGALGQVGPLSEFMVHL